MNPACQWPEFFEAQPIANSADEKSGLACTGAASRQQFFPGLIPNIADCLHDTGPCQCFKRSSPGSCLLISVAPEKLAASELQIPRPRGRQYLNLRLPTSYGSTSRNC
jgi:hypothetical protein